MNREYHKWWSPSLGRDMELLVFGHGGMPYIVFPTSMGKFFEFEDRGMVRSAADALENGRVQFFCPDSVDSESFYNKRIHPADRIRRHIQYENYILNEVAPLVRHKNHKGRMGASGASFGAYHALNISLRHPDVFTDCLAMSGAFDIKQFLHGYYDQNCYFNNPVDYLPNMSDPWFMDRYRQNRMLLMVGEWDICLDENHRMAGIMHARGVPHRLDIWGDRSEHDWPLWQRMAQVYF